MKRILGLSAIIVLSHSVFAGESVGLLLNLKENMKNVSLTEGILPTTRDAVVRSLQSMKEYIEFSEPKLSQKFSAIVTAGNIVCNVTQIAFNKFVAPFKREAQENPFANVSQKTIQGIEEAIKPLHAELKAIKGSIFSNFSLGKKSEAQKVVDGARTEVIEKIQEILKKFEIIKKTKVLN